MDVWNSSFLQHYTLVAVTYVFHYLIFLTITKFAKNLDKIGKIIAHEYVGKQIDAIMTIATKGIPIAQAVSSILDVPFVIVRRDPKVTEGATLNVNYMSGSSSKVENMTLSKRSLAPGQRVLIVDDVISAGTSVRESVELIRAAGATPAGVLIALDRQERGQGELSAVQEVQRDYGIPVIAVAGLKDLMTFLAERPDFAAHREAVARYREQYGVDA